MTTPEAIQAERDRRSAMWEAVQRIQKDRPLRRQLYGCMQAEEAKRLTQLEKENARLKKLLAEAELEKAMLKELAEGTSEPGAAPQGR
jgi:putative transposase